MQETIYSPAEDFHQICPKHGPVEDTHDIEYCLSGDF